MVRSGSDAERGLVRQSRCWVSVLSLVLAVGSGCHTMRFELVDEPAGEVVREHKSYFLWGLAPTVEVDVLNKCPAGAAALRERTTFLDGLMSLPTLGIWSPRSTTYYCRASRSPSVP